jgi:hypothetical protein
MAKRRTNPATPPVSGFGFGDPQFSPDDYTNFTTAQKNADSNLPTVLNPPLQPIPPIRVNPPVMALSSVLPAATLKLYQDYITFHVMGDTGGIKDPSNQFLVADKMVEDFAPAVLANPEDRPAFCFHVGDVVYYYGQDQYYYDQYYDPYRNYPAPIFAIPGNHDAVLPPNADFTSLQAFCRHFCSATPIHAPEAQGMARTTMTQPGVYFTLNAPFLKIIGLYSNTQEGTSAGVIADNQIVGQAQKQFLIAQLKQAKAAAKGFQGAVIIAVHHPPFTLSSQNNPSQDMLADIDEACTQAGFTPDAVFSGHAHLYERYTRYIANRQVPFIVAGCGGYPELDGVKQGAGPPPRTPVQGKDQDGNRVVLENYFGQTFGFMRVSVSNQILSGEFVGVTDQADPGKTLDSFTLDLKQHTLVPFRRP